MTNERILEIARRNLKLTWINDDPESLIVFARSVIEADRESSDEPVAWAYITKDCKIVHYEFVEGLVPLYRRPSLARKPLSEADREKPNDHESSTNQAPMHYYKFNEDGAPIRSDFHFSDGQRITDAGKEKPTA